MAEREVPPVVDLQEIVRLRPVRPAPAHEIAALGGAPLHFQHMRHGMVRPAVIRIGFQRLQSRPASARR
jgi:hypothetical protein